MVNVIHAKAVNLSGRDWALAASEEDGEGDSEWGELVVGMERALKRY